MIPNDPVMLLSYVNTQLRDYYSSLDALCEDKGIGKEELVEQETGAGFRKCGG